MEATPCSQLKDFIESAEKICVFTGAGISCPSGIPDFRSADGLYNEKTKWNYPPEEIISHTFFMEHTDMFYEFYKSKMIYPDAKPNAAHIYFAELEKTGKKVSVVTQNIDGLHQAAGSTEVIELHGSVHRNYCTKCRKFYDAKAVVSAEGIPRCSCGGIIKPDVVLYEEPLDEDSVMQAAKVISEADLLIIIGTSLAVYPAASYIRYFRGDKMVLINKSGTSYDGMADLAIYDDVINVVNKLKK